MKQLIGLILFLMVLGWTASPAKAQTQWSLKAELGGGGLLPQLGANIAFNRWQLGLGVGSLGIFETGTEKSLWITTLPLQLSYFKPFGTGKHGLEVGIGIANLFLRGDLLEAGGSSQWHLNPHAVFQYRFSPVEKPWLFRVGIQPIYGTGSILSPTREAFRPFGLPVLPMLMLGMGYRL